jgi:hypothetical protein
MNMSSTFSGSTRVTLWFTEWTTTTTTTYVLTLFFLFSLGIVNRFLGALKTQLEVKWNVQHEAIIALQPQPLRPDDPDEEETPLGGIEEKGIKRTADTPRIIWIPNAPWNFKRDGISAVLEFMRAFIGYVL